MALQFSQGIHVLLLDLLFLVEERVACFGEVVGVEGRIVELNALFGHVVVTDSLGLEKNRRFALFHAID